MQKLNKTENPFSLQDDEKIDTLYFYWHFFIIPKFLNIPQEPPKEPLKEPTKEPSKEPPRKPPKELPKDPPQGIP